MRSYPSTSYICALREGREREAIPQQVLAFAFQVSCSQVHHAVHKYTMLLEIQNSQSIRLCSWRRCGVEAGSLAEPAGPGPDDTQGGAAGAPAHVLMKPFELRLNTLWI